MGWIAVGHRQADQFDETATEALELSASLIEAILDSDLENTILNELAVQLLGTSLAASTLTDPTPIDPTPIDPT